MQRTFGRSTVDAAKADAVDFLAKEIIRHNFLAVLEHERSNLIGDPFRSRAVHDIKNLICHRTIWRP